MHISDREARQRTSGDSQRATWKAWQIKIYRMACGGPDPIGRRLMVLPDSTSSHLVTVSAWLVGDECVVQIRTPLRLNGRRVSELLYRGGISVTVAVRGSLAQGDLVHHKPENVRSGRFQ